ncbi:MAG: hypothetical protein H6664_04020 [Ardenticatenaceae bacterium]|nr:hypothetical protein [Ardenticatenaceae bacterium]
MRQKASAFVALAFCRGSLAIQQFTVHHLSGRFLKWGGSSTAVIAIGQAVGLAAHGRFLPPLTIDH